MSKRNPNAGQNVTVGKHRRTFFSTSPAVENVGTPGYVVVYKQKVEGILTVNNGKRHFQPALGQNIPARKVAPAVVGSGVTEQPAPVASENVAVAG